MVKTIEMQSIGPWPKRMFDDVNRARDQLKEELKSDDCKFILFGPRSTLNISDALIPRTACSYANALKKNGLVDQIIRIKNTDVNYLILEGTAVSHEDFPEIKVTHGIVKIHDVKWQTPVEAMDVTDERLLELIETHMSDHAFTIFENHPDLVMMEALKRLLITRVDKHG